MTDHDHEAHIPSEEEVWASVRARTERAVLMFTVELTDDGGHQGLLNHAPNVPPQAAIAWLREFADQMEADALLNIIEAES